MATFEVLTSSNVIGGGGGVESVVAGTNITVDDTDPANPIVSATGSSSYLVYVALLSQDLTADPVAIVLQNTLGGTVVWTRDSIGYYIGTLSGAFPVNKTYTSIMNRFKIIYICYFSTIASNNFCSG